MGGSSYSKAFYDDRVAHRAATGTPTFKHDADVKAGKVAPGVHPTLNIRGKIREARDSVAHPNSTPIAVIFDETGSMADVPPLMQAKLPQLMSLLLTKGYIADPQILFGAIGDWTTPERAPLQIGQFESGIEMDDNITHIFLEGNGGGSNHESYQNALYYFAHRTSCDAFEKRGKKGYLFLIGDELSYAVATKRELDELIGDGAQADVPLEDIMAAVKEKWEVFFVLPKGTSNWGSKTIENFWKKHLGQHFITLENPEAICETIGLAIGLLEGTATADGMHADLKDLGTGDAIVHVATASVDAIAKSAALTKVGTGGGALPGKTGKSDAVERL